MFYPIQVWTNAQERGGISASIEPKARQRQAAVGPRSNAGRCGRTGALSFVEQPQDGSSQVLQVEGLAEDRRRTQLKGTLLRVGVDESRYQDERCTPL